MNNIASIILMCLACGVLLLQLYGRKRLACIPMRNTTVTSFLVLSALFVVLQMYESLNS